MGVPVAGQWLTNPTRNHEVVGSIPDLVQWVKENNLTSGTSTMENSMGIYPDKTFLEKDTCTCMFIAVLFTIAKKWNQPKCPQIDDWIRKTGIYTQWNTTQP